MSGWEPIFRRAALQTNIAPELLVRGWELYDYYPPSYQEAAFLSWACQWPGVAIYPSQPGIVLCVCVLAADVQHDNERLGAGWIDDQAHWLTASQPVFHATAVSNGWHIERDGRITASGVFPPECEVDMWQARPAIARVVDEIEGAAFGVKTIRLETPSISVRRARQIIAPLLRGHYRIKRVRASHDQWFIAWIRLPRMPQRQRQATTQAAAELLLDDPHIGAAFGLLERGSRDGLITFSVTSAR